MEGMRGGYGVRVETIWDEDVRNRMGDQTITGQCGQGGGVTCKVFQFLYLLMVVCQ